MPNYKIVIASTNKGKIEEISRILQNSECLRIEIKTLQDYQQDYQEINRHLNNNLEEPEEPHSSFLENAIHKAKYYAAITHEATLSEDSGLCIEALNDFPGVRTKELVTECGGVSGAFRKLEKMLEGTNNYKAYFNSAIVLYIPSHDYLISHEAKDYGTICFPPRGEGGFAFDPIFIPEGYTKTFAELGMLEKNKISHRAKAMQGLIEKLRKHLKIFTK